MAGYNAIRVSEEFRQLAELAEAIFRANEGRLAVDRHALKSHDELLANALVYRYLQDGHFLASPELLLSELRLLRANGQPRSPANALKPVDFVSHRTQLLETLIARFQNLINYRDAIGAGQDAPDAAPVRAAPSGERRRRSTPFPPTRG